MRLLLQWKSNKYYIFWVCVCSLNYPACNSHVPYYIVICGLSGSTTLFHIISQTPWFLREGGPSNVCFNFSTIFVWNISHLRKSQQDMIINSYSYNKSQWDALFLKFILVKNSTCFGQIYCPSSGVSTLYTQHTATGICHASYVETPDDGQ